MIKIIITAILFIGPNFFWGLNVYSQGLKVSYEVTAKHVNNSNPETDRVVGEIARRLNLILPRITFVSATNKEYNKFYYEKGMTTDNESKTLFDLAISVILDGEQIFSDSKNQVAYYESTLINKLRSVEMENVKWTITRESKNILGWKCYKATGKVIDPEAENKLTPPTIAWFCPELGLRGGPTAYTTLPGMILELENHKAKFIAKKIEHKKNLQLDWPGYKPKNILPHKEWTAYFQTNNPIRN